jgi:hypothetical protein
VRVSMTRQDTAETLMRKRFCSDCSSKWFTVEVLVPRWGLAHGQNHTVRRLKGFQKITFS